VSFNPDWCVRPGATLREWCEENGLSLQEAAHACRRTRLETFEGVVAGTTKITPAIAGALQAGTGLSAKFWLTLEDIYRAGLATGKVPA
jgi:plasmid maintenance system antidote protein VapI